MKKADNRFFVVLIIIAVLLALNLILPRIESPRPAFAVNGGGGSIVCSATGKYVFLSEGPLNKTYRSTNYGQTFSPIEYDVEK
jgi:hypothetical protein